MVLDKNSLKGKYDAGAGDWFLGMGEEEAIFKQYSSLLKERLGAGRNQKPPRVWCSWYSLYTEISEEQLVKILGDLDAAEWPVDVFQIDDGWQKDIGDWEPNAKFASGMDGIATRIKNTDRVAGLWLAPLLAVPSSSLYQDHRDWLLHDQQGKLVSAGFNWGEPLYALDTTHPEALEWLANLMKKVRGWGYDYAKLDFLYAGALPGKRYADIPREEAYRNGLKIIREALGEAYLLTCGAPILPSSWTLRWDAHRAGCGRDIGITSGTGICLEITPSPACKMPCGQAFTGCGCSRWSTPTRMWSTSVRSKYFSPRTRNPCCKTWRRWQGSRPPRMCRPGCQKRNRPP